MIVRLLHGFDELPAAAWRALLERSPTQAVFLTPGWMRAWWETLGEGSLLLAVAEREGTPVALAPLFAHDGVVSFVGTDSSDYLDVLGGASAGTLAGMLGAAREASGAATISLAMVPEESPTVSLLEAAAAQLGLHAHAAEPVPAPTLAGCRLPDAAGRRSLVRHERWFAREGELSVWHTADGAEIGPQLETFFDQHVRRCALAPYDSLFEDPRQRAFYRRLAADNAAGGWLRFTRVDWNGEPIAFHFGMCFQQSFLWYKPSFEPELARRSPGEVLLRRLLLAAHAEGARQFDFGIGDEAFKYRFADRVPLVRTWTLRG